MRVSEGCKRDKGQETAIGVVGLRGWGRGWGGVGVVGAVGVVQQRKRESRGGKRDSLLFCALTTTVTGSFDVSTLGFTSSSSAPIFFAFLFIYSGERCWMEIGT